MHTFKQGDRVKLVRNVERFPCFIARAGLTGTVCSVEVNGDLAVRMDETLAGCEEWNNEIHWWEEFQADIGEDLALTISITAAECLDYFARQMSGIANGEGRDYTAAEILACWETMPVGERAEWEDEALEDKIYRAQHD